MARGVRELALVLAGGMLVAAIVTFPLIVQMAHVGRIDSLDADFSMWNVAWVARTLVKNPAHVLDGNIFYPHRDTLVYSETDLVAGALAIPAYWATRNPYFTYNFLVLLSVALGAAGMYYLVRHLVGDRRAAAVAGICFGFCPYMFAHIPSIQLLMTAGLPFSMLAFHRLAERPSMGRAGALGLTMAAEGFACGYYSVFVMLMIGFAVLAVATTRRLWTNTRYWWAVCGAALVATVVMLPLLLAYRNLQGSGFARPLGEASRYSADWRAYLASAALGHRWMLRLLGQWKEVLFPGFVTAIGGVWGLFVGWRRGGRVREVAVLYGGLGLLACWASFGPSALLYTVMYRLVPLFSLMRAPARFGIVVVFALAVLLGLAVRDWLSHTRRPAMVTTALVVVVVGELLNPLQFRRVPPLSPAYTLLARLPPGPVIEMPFFSRGSEVSRHARYMLYSTAHWKPLINGFSDYIPPDFTMAAPVLKDFPTRAAFAAFGDHPPRYAVFHMDIYDDADRLAVRGRLSAFAPFFRPLYVDDDLRLYEIVGVPH